MSTTKGRTLGDEIGGSRATPIPGEKIGRAFQGSVTCGLGLMEPEQAPRFDNSTQEEASNLPNTLEGLEAQGEINGLLEEFLDNPNTAPSEEASEDYTPDPGTGYLAAV